MKDVGPIVWLSVLCLLGGASRADEWQQIAVRLVAIILMIVMFWKTDPADAAVKRPLWILLMVAGLVVGVQLVPLPPGWALHLAGRGTYAAVAEATHTASAWRPLSLTPDLTWNSLLSLLPVAATLAVAPLRGARASYLLVHAIVIAAVVAAAMGVMQTAGDGSALRLYRVTNSDSATGFFANRNHHAIFMALAFPLLGWIALRRLRGQPRATIAIIGIGSAIAAFLGLSVLLAGSRTGLVLTTALTGATLLLATMFAPARTRPRLARSNGARGSWMRRAGLLTLTAGPLLLVSSAALMLSRSPALTRMLATDATHESRIELLPHLARTTWRLMPWGGGFGSFAAVFRSDEPFSALRFTYLNQAHNDALQILFEGGLTGGVVMALCVGLWAFRFGQIMRRGRGGVDALAAVAAIMVGGLFAASLVDYPLRTPLLSGILVFAAVWMLDIDHRQHTADGLLSPDA